MMFLKNHLILNVLLLFQEN